MTTERNQNTSARPGSTPQSVPTSDTAALAQRESAEAAKARAEKHGPKRVARGEGEGQAYHVKSGFAHKGIWWTRANEHELSKLPEEDIAELLAADVIAPINAYRDPQNSGTANADTVTRAEEQQREHDAAARRARRSSPRTEA